MNQLDVINHWASGSHTKAKAGQLWTEKGKLYSYNLLIGETRFNKYGQGPMRAVLNYTTTGGAKISATTTKHVNMAKRVAHLIYPIRTRGGKWVVDRKSPRLGGAVTNRPTD